MDVPSLSIIIPAFNEVNRIGATLEHISAWLPAHHPDGEIIVVDDGSTDGTADLLRREYPSVRLLAHEPNRGKGYAVGRGMLASKGYIRLFCDADGSTPIDELPKLEERLDASADIVIGSRALPDSDIRVRQSIIRENMGRAFNKYLQLLSLSPFADTQCGFKVFKAEAAKAVFRRRRIDRFGFDVETLFIAAHLGLRVEQVPVIWRNSPDSRVRILHDSVCMLRDATSIRLNSLLHRYD